jgi:site-specific DNA-adenine methylase
MKAPFPWFGGKRRVADVVWAALGDVDNYVEPFAGSLACLLERPPSHRCRAETANDADRFLANFWRALAADPYEVASWADWPVNEADLEARHLWLVTEGRHRVEAMASDPEWFDAKVAGWWVWGINSWIGSGWCAGTGPWVLLDDGTVGQLPHLGSAGQGINRQLPHLGSAGQGINRQLPHLGDAGRGTSSQGDFSSGGSGAPAVKWDNPAPDLPPMYGYLMALADRLRKVRVCCGDWSRVVTNGALNYGATVGVFLDPPYLGDVRTSDLYATDDHTIAHEVRQWCLDNGDNPRYRIVLAGYSAEHDHLIPDTWRRHSWSGTGGYAGTNTAGSVNRHGETLWLSPGCLGGEPDAQGDLFGGAA